jgi:hypothetical protein
VKLAWTFAAPAATSSASSEAYKKRVSSCAFSTISVIRLILLFAPLPIRLAPAKFYFAPFTARLSLDSFEALAEFMAYLVFARVPAVRQAHKNQYRQDHCGDAERGLLAVPFLRLPHCKVLAGDNHEAEKPEGKADS